MADRRLQVFHAVAKHLSFTKAAEELFMSQPAVTFQVKQLEDEHQTRLFERRHGLVSLTPAGELLQGYAEKILHLSDEVETRLAELSGEMRGLLQIGVTSSQAETLVPLLLADFNARYPQVRTRVWVGNSTTLESQVASHVLDLALIDHSTDQDGLNYESCGEEELVLICSPDYPLAQKKQIAPATLPEYEYIAREPGSGTRAAFDKYLNAHAIPAEELKMLMELGSDPSLKALVASGLGFGVSGRKSLSGALATKELKAISFKPMLKRSLQLISAQDRYNSRATLTFIELARSRAREWLA